ncbi:hypothetical protein [Sphingomonas sp. PvP015]
MALALNVHNRALADIRLLASRNVQTWWEADMDVVSGIGGTRLTG